jgi:hypothetical protein
MRKRLALILACGLGIAGCGSSSNGDSKNTAKRYSQALAFSQCMRAHGVSNYPDPTSRPGGGVELSIGSNSGVNTEAPAFQPAQTSCKHLLPGGGPGSGPPSPQAMAQMLQLSECMRAHGISGFPDPTSRPPANTSDYSGVMGRNGAWLAIPNSLDPKSPAFRHAGAACNFGPNG